MSAVGAGHACDSNIPNTITPAIPHQSCLITWGVCRLFADARPWSQAWPAPTKAHSLRAATAISQTPSRQQSPIRAVSLRWVFAGYLLMRGRGRRHGQLLQKHTHPAHYHRANNHHPVHYHRANNNPVIHAG